MNAITAFTTWFPHRAGSFAFAANLYDSISGGSNKSVKHAKEAAEVRQLASGYMQSAPGFAADLLAAVDRHELLISNEVKK